MSRVIGEVRAPRHNCGGGSNKNSNKNSRSTYNGSNKGSNRHSWDS